jgi:hypothetical protein
VSAEKTVILSGHSDDLVELDGDIREEWTSYGEQAVVVFSDGTVLEIEFKNPGVWRITTLASGGADLAIEQAPADDEDNYSDKATLSGDIRWAIFTCKFEVARHTEAGPR